MAKKKSKIQALGRKAARERYGVSFEKELLHQQMDYARVQNMYNSFYGGIDPRRRNEMADGGMVSEDLNAMANLSPEGFQKEYPRAGYYSNPYIDDSVEEE